MVGILVGPQDSIFAQTASIRAPITSGDRIKEAIDDATTVALPGNVHPMARPEYDTGPVPGAFRLEHLTAVLKRDPSQQMAIDSLSVALQDPRSPLYHKWLQPDEFAHRFGVSAGDLNRMTQWLRAQGFEVDPHSIGPMIVGFSGSVSQVEQTFHSSIRFYRIGGVLHYANAGDLRIPRALDGLLAGVMGMNDFRPRPLVRPHPHLLGQNGQDFMTPTDFEAIYNLLPYSPSNLNGTGQTIAVTAPCSVNAAVVQKFWGSSRPIQTSFYGNVPVCDSNSAPEVYLDLEWAGAIAPGAAIVLVASDQGVSDAAYQAVQNQLAPIITTSYVECEDDLGAAGNSFFGTLWQQAHVFGITSLVASGDTGAAACDDPSGSTATNGLGVNGICSSPWSLCVGGTEFNEGGSSAYWSSLGAARGYVPEVAWNESGANGGSGLAAGGGGYSTIYSAPSWQSGNPNPMRGIPDVALSAAAHDGYVFCPENDPSQCGGSEFWYASGTSAATPAFAGIIATVFQYAGQPQGNPASTLYALASGLCECFNDVVSGNNNVPGQPGYSAGPGWDPVTGLGSVNGGTLALNFTPPPALSLTVSPSQIEFGDVAVGNSASKTITITNTGPAATAGSSIQEGPNTDSVPTDFLNSSCFFAELSPGASCETTVTFKPLQSGTFTAYFSASAQSPTGGGPFFKSSLIQLRGSGVSSAAPVSNQEVAAAAPPVAACAAPAPESAFTSTATVYLFFVSVVSATDKLTSDWLAPDGTLETGARWATASGSQCFTTSLNLATINAVPLGTWLARVYDNSVLLFTVPFSVSATSINGPSINDWGVVSAATSGTTISPGSLFVIYGNNLANGTSSGFGFPLPQTWNGTSVAVNGAPAVLLYVSPTQINAQAPATIPFSPGSSLNIFGASTALASVTVAANGMSVSGQVYVSGTAPGIFVDATGHAIATHADGTLVTRSSPAQAGEEVVVYGTGPGSLTVTPQTGYPAGVGSSLSVCDGGIGPNNGPEVFVGGPLTTVDFCGLTPGLAGLLQVNFNIPSGLPAGDVRFYVEFAYGESPPALLTVSPQ